MENVTKALIMAAGILVFVMLLSLIMKVIYCCKDVVVIRNDGLICGMLQ